MPQHLLWTWLSKGSVVVVSWFLAQVLMYLGDTQEGGCCVVSRPPLYKVGGSYQFIYLKKSVFKVDFPNMQNRKQDEGFSVDTKQSEKRV